MKPGRGTAGQLVAILGTLSAYAALAYATPRPYFGQLLACYLLAFAGYAWLLWRPLPLRYGLLLALAGRLLWLPALPALSDDYHRFRWDGQLVAEGQNPYRYRPAEVRQQIDPSTAPEHRALLALYPRLNSPQYYSVYPPISQAVFAVASRLFPTSERGFVLVLRLCIILAETATAGLLLVLLRRFELPRQRAMLYLLNPLIIVELTGNLHFEALMICGLLAALWAFTHGRWVLSALALAGAVATKLLPLLLLPLLLRRLGGARFLGYSAVTGLGLLLLFAPFLSAELVQNLSRSLDLYFHKFEFNASIYYLLRALGYWQTGYNQIARLGTLLAVATGSIVVLLALTEKRPTWASLPQALLFTLTGYFALATTVHPWYLTTLVALSVFSCYRYALVWSAVVPLSYAAYQTAAYAENLWLVGLEYGVVSGVLLWELRNRNPRAAELA
ncbi:hypothetical protein LGH70_03850 [Hymenobacter sp. BT635]|uniref:DUF2029 domain-containing protein n=1 Tax=Hymenobacter nitidus TaxID=2880929 RepID=A0ABS8A8G7_9BACT|nr:hypothetical protein [Hymenobacter nitidus]MCB2376697.1 hypothetical protein [Hymenobacter nitidus]